MDVRFQQDLSCPNSFQGNKKRWHSRYAGRYSLPIGCLAVIATLKYKPGIINHYTVCFVKRFMSDTRVAMKGIISKVGQCTLLKGPSAKQKEVTRE
jgi:hypothetical protein